MAESRLLQTYRRSSLTFPQLQHCWQLPYQYRTTAAICLSCILKNGEVGHLLCSNRLWVDCQARQLLCQLVLNIILDTWHIDNHHCRIHSKTSRQNAASELMFGQQPESGTDHACWQCKPEAICHWHSDSAYYAYYEVHGQCHVWCCFTDLQSQTYRIWQR